MDAPALLLLSDIVKSLMPLVGIMMIVTALMMMLRNRRKRSAHRLTPMEQVERYQQERGMRQDLESLMVEIEQLARRFSSQLDAKSVQLEKLLREADEKIAQLQQTSAATQTPQTPQPRSSLPGAGETPGVLPPGVKHASHHKAHADAPARSGAGEDELARQVYRLADEGLTSDQIARRLDEHVGKVELILALRK
ncbi:MAG: hypothetical protein IT445_06760 [Phycisphaeraceae bacterium]|nr:hypothetical protein [Phycisphaeraceae bacterium]